MPEIDQSTLEQLQRDASAAAELRLKLATEETARQTAETKAQAAERQYNSVQGNLVTVTAERKTLQEQLASLSSNTEQTKAQIQAEKAELEGKITAKEQLEAELNTKLTQKDEELEVLRLVATEYPELADWYSKGRIVPNGKKGEELKTFLDGWSEDFSDLKKLEKRERGQRPNPPPGNQQSMTYEEVQDRKNEVARTEGYNSKEYRELAQIEEQLFKEGKYKR